MRHHHGLQQRCLHRMNRRRAKVFLRRQHNFAHQINRHLIAQRQRPHRHSGLPRQIFDHGGRDAFHQHQLPFQQIIGHAAVGIKAAAVIDHNRRLFNSADKIHGCRQRRFAGFFTQNNFHQQHFLHRREKMNADEVFRLGSILRQRGDGQG